jgi:N-acetylglucosaminyldiphosphoundecaprenol N-acetyl-beta-D-mannosaminyltransferase
MPRAEIWAHKHHALPVRVTLCVGGTLDIMGGKVKLAPRTMRAVGLEWLYRLITQPWRIWRLKDIPRFVWAVVRGNT